MGNPLFELSDENFVVAVGTFVTAQNDRRAHVNGPIEEGDWRRTMRCQAQHLPPQLRTTVGSCYDLPQAIDVEFVARNTFELGNQTLVLTDDPIEMIRCDVTERARGHDSQHRHAELSLVESEPFLHVTALIRVVDEDVRPRD